MGVALWLCPKYESSVHETLTSLHSGLSLLFPGSPRFEPHITITSQLNCNTKDEVRMILGTSLAALKGLSLNVVFNSLNIKEKNSFFKKIYIGVEREQTLTSLALLIREMFVEKDDESSTAQEKAKEWALQQFEPHLSLVYTDLPHFDLATQRTIVTRVEDYLNLGNIEVNADDEVMKELGWTNGSLKVVRCEGPIEQWEVLGAIDIH
ncbi:hypothetical protein WICPIJ_009920 [Wickerhamomyces pijperi]|uniref:2',3'-cyclic-nucleotide 3'-phosphodiesterase n=1 Tax=Wickerhamomyces pijperi TaxID=599730 RepID=A0A9P8PKN5_WICPI|nr:hypothetical protein WICPIJ_009920 [Wickerhamomyces pijperi]